MRSASDSPSSRARDSATAPNRGEEMPAPAWSNLSKITLKRTYSRILNPDDPSGPKESFPMTVERMIEGNVRGHNVGAKEIERLRYFMLNRKAGPGGRGYWFSGTESHYKLGGAALCNCWFMTSEHWRNFVIAQDLLMLGGGVGMSVQQKYTSKLPRVKKGVVVVHKATKDADFIVPDSREGWNELMMRVYEAFFVTGRSFTYSTVCVRGAGEPIRGFGGTSSGPLPLIDLVDKVVAILREREGRHIRPIDAADLICAHGEMVKAGNVRRSALIVIGDSFDKEYLRVKRWDLGLLPSQRGYANFSVACDDIDDLHPNFWKSYEVGEPIGLVNLKNIRKYGRMGEPKPDTATGVNPCAEATLEPFEPCNLQEIALPNLDSVDEFEEAARLMHRWGKRVTMEKYHHAEIEEVIKRNRRVGTGITGCLQAPQFFTPAVLDRVYAAIQEENVSYSKELGINQSIRTTLIKPSGTMSKVLDVSGEGIHPGYSRYMIQRIRFAATDPLLPILKAAGHYMEPEIKLDGGINHGTVVVDFYIEAPPGLPLADDGFDTWKQLDALLMAQKHWADQAVSITVYYKREEIPKIKAWLSENLDKIKTISFLAHQDHGFKQAPKEAITKEQYDRLSSKIQPIEMDMITGDDLESQECAGGMCPIK